MNHYLAKKRIFAVVFIVSLLGFSIVNFIHSKDALVETVQEEAVKIEDIDTAMNENMFERMKFVETYSYLQLLLNKRESNNFSYVKDEKGFLHYSSFYQDDNKELFEYATRVKRLQDYVSEYGTEVVFIVPPGKYSRKWCETRFGLPINETEEIVDELLFHLNRLDVETIDLRCIYDEEELPYEEMFFKTDHHWTVPAAFRATEVIVDKIEEFYGERLDPGNYYMSDYYYDVVTYQDVMLGSMGRRTGVNFSEIEDFTAYWPKDEGNYYREYISDTSEEKKIREGDYSDVILDMGVFSRNADIYSNSYYTLYLNGVLNYEKLVNLDKPDGCSIFMIRDSYMSPVMSFMIPMCSEIHAIWSLEESEEIEIESYVKENRFDYIFVEVYPYNINADAFDYFKDMDMEE